MDLYQHDLKGQSGGVLISDIVDGNQIILLGKSNIPKRKDTFESFGGKVEKTDISSLHTAIRELVEEFFNMKISVEILEEICSEFRKNNYILKQYNYYGVSYLINLDGLNKVYQKLCILDENLLKYNDNKMGNHQFNYIKYMEERIVNDIPQNGLNEIKSIHMITLDDILNNKVNIRWFTNKVIGKMLKQKKIDKSI
jgi:hypothetical protein